MFSGSYRNLEAEIWQSSNLAERQSSGACVKVLHIRRSSWAGYDVWCSVSAGWNQKSTRWNFRCRSRFCFSKLRYSDSGSQETDLCDILNILHSIFYIGTVSVTKTKTDDSTGCQGAAAGVIYPGYVCINIALVLFKDWNMLNKGRTVCRKLPSLWKSVLISCSVHMQLISSTEQGIYHIPSLK